MALSITLGILGAAVFSWFFKTLAWFLLLLYLSFVIATILDAPVTWLRNRGLRRGLGTVLVMVSCLVLISSVAYLLIDYAAGQVAGFEESLGQAPGKINDFVHGLGQRYPVLKGPTSSFDVQTKIPSLMPTLASVPGRAQALLENLTYLIVTFFLIMYMLIDGPAHLQGARRLLPKRSRRDATQVFEEMAQVHRGWFLASAVNVASASILTTLGLTILGVKGSVVLGIIAGLGELVPNIGPFFGALPALVLVLFTDTHMFLYVVGMFLLVQTIQGYTISPLVMRNNIELPVLAIIISVIVMGTLFGLLGIIIAIPLTADLVVLWNYVNTQLEKDNGNGNDTVNSNAGIPAASQPLTAPPPPAPEAQTPISRTLRNPREWFSHQHKDLPQTAANPPQTAPTLPPQTPKQS